MLFNAVLVAAGGFFGAISRYFISQCFNQPNFHIPVGTFAVNLGGSFLLGWLAGSSISQTWMLFFGTGLLGAFTTFSTLNWESIQFQQQSEWGKMIFYLGISYTGILLAFIGFYCGRFFLNG